MNKLFQILLFSTFLLIYLLSSRSYSEYESAYLTRQMINNRQLIKILA